MHGIFWLCYEFRTSIGLPGIQWFQLNMPHQVLTVWLGKYLLSIHSLYIPNDKGSIFKLSWWDKQTTETTALNEKQTS